MVALLLLKKKLISMGKNVQYLGIPQCRKVRGTEFGKSNIHLNAYYLRLQHILQYCTAKCAHGRHML